MILRTWKEIKNLKHWFCKTFALNDAPLFKQKILLIVLIPLTIALVLWGGIFFGPYEFDPFNVDAQKTFLDISKIELWLIALIPIIVAFIATAHRTVQTSHQISLTLNKNKQDSYYTHIKYISESLLSHKLTIKYVISEQIRYRLFLDGLDFDAAEEIKSIEITCTSPKKLYLIKFNENNMLDGVSIGSSNIIENNLKDIVIKYSRNVVDVLIPTGDANSPQEEVIKKIHSIEFVNNVAKVSLPAHRYIMTGFSMMLFEMLKVIKSDSLSGTVLNYHDFLHRFDLNNLRAITSQTLNYTKLVLDAVSCLDEETEELIDIANKMVARYYEGVRMHASHLLVLSEKDYIWSKQRD